jgi:1A family penicillin-binding protein
MSVLKKIRKQWRRVPAWLEFSLIGIAVLVLLLLGAGILWATFIPLPSINNFENRQVAQSTKIYDRTGNIVLYDVHGSVRRTAVTLDQISPYIQNATIAIEDASFYQNAGFRPLSFLRAMAVDLFSGSYAQGGSTITQQVVKNALLTQDKTIERKIEEIILALRLTKAYSKDQILNVYLNETSYGGTIYGVQEASQYYFGVDAKDVDLAQAAYLAALPAAPTYYSPYGNNRAALDTRKNLVLQQMKENGLITADEYTQAIAETVQFKDENEAGIKAPHFVFYIREYLEEKYGADVVANGGLKVITTLDYDLQQKAEDTVAKWAPQMLSNFNASNEGVVAIDPKTGQILAMVGSKGYFDPTIDGKVNVTLTNRQPGSSFKPFVYATAFEKGFTPDTVVFDLPTQFSTSCSPQDNTNDTPPCYSPSNFDGTFKGPMTLRDAIAQSENVPSVKVVYLAGVAASIKTAEDLGITTLGNAAQYGLTLVLGGGEVNLLEMTGAYSVFANDGVKNPPTGILEVDDSSGNVLEKYQSQPTQELDPQIARQINSILSDNVARTPEFGAESPLQFDSYDVADKTGTTNDYRDVWVLGYTPDIAVGAWAGNNDNTPMAKKIAAFIIAPMWHDFMAEALTKYSSPSDTFPAPAPDPDVASLPPVLEGNWNTDPSQGVHDILYWVNKDDPRGPPPTNPWSDPQAAYWDYPVQLWAAQNPQLVNGAASGAPVPAPTETTAPTSSSSNLRITSPQQGASVPFGFPTMFTASDSSSEPVTSVLYYVNGSLIGTTGQAPYSVSYTPDSRGVVTLRAVAEHPSAPSEEQTITFTVQ